MQVHAVPESERAYDSSGRRLPWGYEYADPDMKQRRAPEEKGPFGKPTRRRSLSRTKTTTPSRKEDLAQLENAKAMDDVFTSFKARLKAKTPDSRAPPHSVSTGSLPAPRSNEPAQPLSTSLPSSTIVPQPVGEPSMVILYGFGSETQYAAIEFYERVSGGNMYEDYDRHPPNSRYNFTLSASRSANRGNISQTALRMRNSYAGGDHWIKVTFDSKEAAERACEASPHVICGFVVHAEPYRGLPPNVDQAVPATDEVLASLQASPGGTQSSATLGNTNTQSSITLSSGTMTGTSPPATNNDLPLQPRSPLQPRTPLSMRVSMAQSPLAPETASTSARPSTTPLRIRGAKRVVLLPAEEALLPVHPWWRTFLISLPMIGWLVRLLLDDSGAANQGVIGDTLPRKEDGSFDWDRASVYWTFWAWFDTVFGTDYCGIRSTNED